MKIKFCGLFFQPASSVEIVPAMQTSFFCFLTVSALLGSHALAVLTLTPGIDATASIFGLNTSTLGIPTPPETFDLRYTIAGPKLRLTSCLMNTIAALKELALGDWDGKIIDGTEYTLDKYPEVSIVITTPKRKRNVQARFVIWAICLGVLDMISKKKFEFAQFEMLLEDQVLGWVQVVNHPTSAALPTEERHFNGTPIRNNAAFVSDTNHTAGPTPINITNMFTTKNADDPAEARLNVTFSPHGDTLGIYDVFVPIMSGLADMAQFPSTRLSTGLIIGLEGFNGFICILPVVPLRTTPPFMEYGWLMRAITRIPTYMLETGRFGEINMKIGIDEVTVGYGRLTTGPDCDPDALLATSLGVTES